MYEKKNKTLSICFGSTYYNGNDTERIVWPLYKDDMQIHEAVHIFQKVDLMCSQHTKNSNYVN